MQYTVKAPELNRTLYTARNLRKSTVLRHQGVVTSMTSASITVRFRFRLRVPDTTCGCVCELAEVSVAKVARFRAAARETVGRATA